MDEILRRFNPWWEHTYEFPGIPREHYLSLMRNLETAPDVVLITGLRRVGKTTLLYQFIHYLLEKTDPGRILYVSLDNISFRDHTIQEIIDEFRRICSLKHNDHVYLFLDEVHFKDDYELELKNLYDLGYSKVFASGSASLDIIMRSPYLTGRQRIIRISPLSFDEYLKVTGKELSLSDQHLYQSASREFVETGGMPEFVKTRDPNVLQSLLDTILYRDIVGRHNIRNRESIKDVLLFVAQSVSTPISAMKIARIIGIKTDTVRMILDLLVESNLVHIVEREGKFSERKVSPRKFYLADTGLFTVLAENINIGARVENLVYLTLARSGKVRYHRAHGKEIDFIQGKHAFESKYKRDIGEKDIAALKTLRGIDSKTVITDSKMGKLNSVDLVPLWRFLLDHEP